MNKSLFSLRSMAEISLYATLIFLSIQVLKIPTGGSQFIHFGNAMVVVGCLLFGSKKGAFAAAIGLGIYDILNGYVSVVGITILESLIVAFVIYVLYEKTLHSKDTIKNVIFIAVIAAITKIILNLIKYTLTNVFVGNLSIDVSFGVAVLKIIGTYGSSLATVIAVPILYPILKSVFSKLKKAKTL